MGGGKGKKKTLMQYERLFFWNMLRCETDQLRARSAASFAGSAGAGAGPTVMH